MCLRKQLTDIEVKNKMETLEIKIEKFKLKKLKKITKQKTQEMGSVAGERIVEL